MKANLSEILKRVHNQGDAFKINGKACDGRLGGLKNLHGRLNLSTGLLFF